MISPSDSPAALIKELRANGFRVYAEGDKLHVIPTKKLLPWVSDTIAFNKWALIACLEREEHARQVKAMEEIVREASQEMDRLRRELGYAEQEKTLMQIQIDCLEMIAQRARRTSKPALVLDDNLLRQAIGLTHPDRHGNSQVANEVTSALIKLRDQQREASRHA